MVIGDPIAHSLSPLMHNAGYQALQIDDLYVYVACHVEVKNIEDFIKGIRAMQIQGVSCTVPHKIAVMPYLDKIDDIAKKIGAVNTIVNDNGRLIGYNTDWLGVLTPLEKLTSLENKTVALLGAGGAARAAAYAVTTKGARLTIYNRTFEKAQSLALEFGGKASELDDLGNVINADIIINTTSLGLKDKNQTPLPKNYITKNQIVFDAVYGKEETKLISEAKEQGAKTISGIEMLLHQGLAQFKLFTKHDAPEETMRKVLI
jgi:shikimate dehydrogenase